jgi:hypothetical protein
MVLGTLLLAAMALCVPTRAEEAKNGTVTGILTAKGTEWIEVKAEGEKESVRYIPCWRGGLPKDGGGFDKGTLETIKKTPVATLVKVAWQLEEAKRRIVSLEVIAPVEKSGTVTGTVVAKGETWIDVTPDKVGDKQGPTERYWPRWIGGMPKDGGGLDKDMLRAIAAAKVGDKVEIKWMYDERKRVVQLTVTVPAPPPATDTRK